MAHLEDWLRKEDLSGSANQVAVETLDLFWQGLIRLQIQYVLPATMNLIHSEAIMCWCLNIGMVQATAYRA